MADANDPKTDHNHLAPICCHQPKPEGAEPVRCSKCNRPLKTEASIAAGIGPTCAKKVRTILEEPLPPRKGRKIRVDPNQLGLFVATKASPSDLPREGAGGAIKPTSEAGEEQLLDGPGNMLACTMSIELTIICPGGHPSLHVAVSQGGVPCKGC